MAYQTPEYRREAVEAADELLRAARRVVLTTHVNADGDGTGSEVAVAAWLRALGTDAWIVNPTPYPDMFRFMVPDPGWIVDASTPRAVELCAQADVAVVLDTGEVSRIGRVKPLIDDLTTIVVDHHPPGDQAIGGISLRDPTACATGELVYDLILKGGGPWPAAALEGLYIAILTDTGSFRFANSTPGSHRIAAELIEAGVAPEELHRQVYGSSPMRRFHLLRAALDTLQVDEEAGVAWMRVPSDAFRRLGAVADDLEGLVDYPRSVEGVEVGILFRETTHGDTKISFRSNGAVDVNVLAREFGGGGHVKASGAMVSEPPKEVLPRVVAAARDAVRRHRRQRSEAGARSDGEPSPQEARRS